jgi:transposase-like protein
MLASGFHLKCHNPSSSALHERKAKARTRAMKRRCASMKGFKSFTNAAITIAGIELAHRIHKRQFTFGLGRPRRHYSLKVRWQPALA